MEKNTQRMDLFRLRLRTRLAFINASQSALADRLGLKKASLHRRVYSEDIRLGMVEEFATNLNVSSRFFTDPSEDAWTELYNDPPEWAVKS